MSDKRFEATFFGDVINCVKSDDGNEYNLQETVDLLNMQQCEIKFWKSKAMKLLVMVRSELLPLVSDEKMDELNKRISDG